MTRKKQFQEALKQIEIKSKEAVVQTKDVEFILDAGFKLLMTFEDMEKARAKWRLRAENAEAQLKKTKENLKHDLLPNIPKMSI